MYTLNRLQKGFTVKFSATFEGIDAVCLDIEQFIAENGFGKLCFNVILGAREALSNAVRHGSEMDPDKNILFFFEANSQEIRLRIIDSGSGFDWREVRRKVARPTDTHGRGIEMLTQFFDSCRFNERGNEVELIKKVRNGDCS